MPVPPVAASSAEPVEESAVRNFEERRRHDLDDSDGDLMEEDFADDAESQLPAQSSRSPARQRLNKKTPEEQTVYRNAVKKNFDYADVRGNTHKYRKVQRAEFREHIAQVGRAAVIRNAGEQFVDYRNEQV